MKLFSKQSVFYFLVLSLGILFYCYEFFLRISPSVVMGDLMQHFNIDALGFAKLVSLYYLAYAIGQIPAGLLLDRYPLKIMLAGSALLCSLATLFFAATESSIMGEVSRFCIGFASSFAFVGALKMGELYLPSQYFTRVVGITVALGTISAAYGNVLLAYLLQGQNWVVLFHYVAAIGLVISVLFIAANFYLPKQNLLPETSAYSLKDLKSLVQSRFLWINALLGGLFYLPSAVLSDIWGNAFLHTTYHLNFIETTGILSFMFIGWMVGSPLMGTLADLVKNTWLIMAIGALCTLIILITLFSGQPFIGKHLHLMLFAFGFFGSSQLGVWKNFHQHSNLKLAATGIAMTNMIITLSVTFGQYMMGLILNQYGQSNNINAYSAADFHHALFWLSMPLVMVIVCQIYMRRARILKSS